MVGAEGGMEEGGVAVSRLWIRAGAGGDHMAVLALLKTRVPGW